MSERDIFTAAREITDPAARSAYLDRACGGDAGVKARVEALLRADDQPESLLDHPAVAPPDHVAETTAAIGHERDPATVEEVPLGFLAPATRPRSLGRIGHYEVLQVLGQGGFGIVFRAFDDVLQRVVAVKVLSPQMAATSPARKRFLREARSSAQVRHENVVQVYEVGEQPLPYIAMEFIPGETLQQRLDRVGPLDVPDVLRIGRQVADGLAAAHANDLIHRDIKPGNILLEGGQLRVKITDFGLARAVDDASISQSGIIAGTPMYMAPEQAKGETLDHRADLFSLGSVLYQMAAGRPPFRATGTVAVLKRVAEDHPRPIREIIPETPQWLCDIIAKLHAKDPDDRYQSAREVADVLADCEAQLKADSKLKDFSRIPRRGRLSARTWKWVAAAAVVLLPAIVLAVTELVGVTQLFRGQRSTGDLGELGQPTVPIHAVEDADGWEQLFNGKDLSGWKTHPDDPAAWTVEKGAIVGRQGESYLFTEEGSFENFHLRAEAKVSPAGDGGVLFRAPFAVRRKKDGTVEYSGGYEAQINVRSNWPVHTGSLCRPPVESPADGVLQTGPLDPHRADEWFVLEVIAQGNRVQTKVDGKPTADYQDKSSRFQRGHIALQNWSGAGTSVYFRKIEVKKLPDSPPAEQWTPLFNGKDLMGWKGLPGLWRIEGNDVIGSTAYPQGVPANTFLVGQKSYRDFELRFQVRIKGEQGNTGVQFRSAVVDGQRFVVHGRQIDVGRGVWGYLYQEGSPGRFLAQAPADVVARTIKPLGFNEFHVRCVGKHLTVRFNGETTIDSDFPDIPDEGVLALQIHHGSPIEVTFRKVEIRQLMAGLGDAPLTDAERLASLPAAEQTEELGKELMRRNRDF